MEFFVLQDSTKQIVSNLDTVYIVDTLKVFSNNVNSMNTFGLVKDISTIIVGFASLFVLIFMPIWVFSKNREQNELQREMNIKHFEIQNKYNLDLLSLQKEHMMLMIKPSPLLDTKFTKDFINIKIHNFGLGPLIVKDLIITYENNIVKSFKHVLLEFESFFANKNLSESYVQSFGKDSTLGVKEGYDLLYVKLIKDNIETSKIMDAIKNLLFKCTIEISISDIYGNSFPTYKCHLLSHKDLF
jgi:hypothetical protein